MTNDTRYVQGFINRGELVPYGAYECPGPLELPFDYVDRARAIGREPDLPGGWFSLSEVPGARLLNNGQVYAALSGRVRPPTDGELCQFPMEGNVSGPNFLPEYRVAPSAWAGGAVHRYRLSTSHAMSRVRDPSWS